MTGTPDDQIASIEQDLAGAAILTPALTEIPLQAAEFADPTIGAIWQAIGAIHREGHTTDPATIAAHAGCQYQRVTELLAKTTTADLFDGHGYAKAIKAAAARRRLDVALLKAHQQTVDGTTPLDEITAQLTSNITTTEDQELLENTWSLDEFCDQQLPDQEWTIPGLLARGDRAIITGAEGFGKSQLIRQMAICAACGVHPFTLDPTPPRRVLVVDAENPTRIMVNKLRAIRDALRRAGHECEDRLWIHRFPQGLDLGSEHDRLELSSLCRTFQPDILAIGPAYKLYLGGSNTREEDLARIVTNALDGLRERFDCTVVLEHHSPHAQAGQKRTTRPIGSSLWMRWPEFGVGIRPADESTKDHRVADVEHWRGMREERDWPEKLEQDTFLPWRQAQPDSYRTAA